MENSNKDGKIRIACNILPRGNLPFYASSLAAGADVIAAIEAPITIAPGERKLIPTGLILEIPEGYEVQLRPRSGLAWKSGITLVNSPGTIDADYRGEVKIILINHGEQSFTVEPGMRIAQMVVAKVETASFYNIEQELSSTGRGTQGFGHTGI